MATCRSLIYVPASRPRMLDRLPGLPADLVAVDLEDGVAVADKRTARQALSERAGSAALARALLRINPPTTPWHDDDVALAASLRPAGLLVPKAEEPSAIAALAARIPCGEHGVALMIETARGVARVHELASVEGVTMLVLGSADLRLSLGARPGEGRAWERHAMESLLLAARARGLGAIDSVYFRFRDEAGLRRHAAAARELGYDGKSCIHPDQVPPIHEVFGPTADERAWAGRVLAAWSEQDGEARGVVVVDGEMIEALHVDLARRIFGTPGGST